MWTLKTHPSPRSPADGRDQPSTSSYDRRHDDPQPFACHAAVVCLRGRQVQQICEASPDRPGLEEVHAFQIHLISTGTSWSALNQIVCALRFFFGVTLGRSEILKRIPQAREPRKLPIVLGADEVVRFLEAVSNLKQRAALTTAYATGLRASETISLHVDDIDSARMVIHVQQGKGGKDRYVMISPQLLTILRIYWRLAKLRGFLFPGRAADTHARVSTLHAACRSARIAARLDKHAQSTPCGTASPHIFLRAVRI